MKKTESGHGYHEVAAGESGHQTRFWIYLPSVVKARETPCVVIAPAGTRMFHALELSEGDQDEHTPWVEAGFVVVAYEIESRFEDTMTGKEIATNVKAFLAAKSGVENGKAAVSFAQRLPQVDASRIYVVGHSSAATLALQLAAADRRIGGVVAFAPVVDLGAHFGEEFPATLDGIVKGPSKKLFARSPHKLVSKLRQPLYLFCAKDDDVAPPARPAEFTGALQKRNKRVVLKSVDAGGHYEPMIDAGIPGAIEWVRSGMKATPKAGDSKK
ncbi:MAG: alpha/beta hydrolase family protein [Planctomycetota bacterium]